VIARNGTRYPWTLWSRWSSWSDPALKNRIVGGIGKERAIIRNALARAFIVVTSVIWAGAAQATDVSGIWLEENGRSKVRFETCGTSLCGTIVWLKNSAGPGKIGERVFYDMVVASGNSWSGKAFDPASGREYRGRMTLAGDSLTTAGCAFWGLICRSFVWSRAIGP
jgi:uncharacterized protein (DUF2147 family)